MNIDGLGPQNLAALQANELVHSVADLYALTEAELTELDRFAEKSAENLVRAIAASKENSLDRLIYALGIRGIGSRAAKLLCERRLWRLCSVHLLRRSRKSMDSERRWRRVWSLHWQNHICIS